MLSSWGKSRVVPLTSVTVPRLELVAALLSVKIAMFLHKELDYETIEHFTGLIVKWYWVISVMNHVGSMCLWLIVCSK